MSKDFEVAQEEGKFVLKMYGLVVHKADEPQQFVLDLLTLATFLTDQAKATLQEFC